MNDHRNVLWPAAGPYSRSTIEAVGQLVQDLEYELQAPGFPEAVRCLAQPLANAARELRLHCEAFETYKKVRLSDVVWNGPEFDFEGAVQKLIACVPWLRLLAPNLVMGLHDEAAARDDAAGYLRNNAAFVDSDGAVVRL
jgi:hypothetical protein